MLRQHAEEEIDLGHLFRGVVEVHQIRCGIACNASEEVSVSDFDFGLKLHRLVVHECCHVSQWVWLSTLTVLVNLLLCHNKLLIRHDKKEHIYVDDKML